MILRKTPIETYPFLAMFVENNVFCDLGCGNGEIVEEMRLYARKSIGIEKKLTLNDKIIREDFTRYLPEADVYYMWVGNPGRAYNAIKDKISGILLVGANTGREYEFIDKNCDYLEEFNIGDFYFFIGVFFCWRKEEKCIKNQT